MGSRQGPGARNRVIKVGAESVVSGPEFLGVPAVAKERRPKAYRHPVLERRLRIERLVHEARMIPQARRAGVRVPAVLDVDVERGLLVLEYVAGPTAKEVIEVRSGRVVDSLCSEIGRMAGRVHGAGILRDDLTR